MADAIATKTETIVKADAIKVETSASLFYKTELAKAKAELLKLESETFSGKVLLIAIGVAFILGVFAPFIVKHL